MSRPLRIAGKALALFVVFDLFQALLKLDSKLENLSLYRHLTPPLARLDVPRDYPTPVAWRLDPLLDAHQIGRPKLPGEIRVAVLGDSGTFDYFSPASEGIPGQMTRLNSRRNGRTLRAYNLAYQTPNSLKDVVIAMHAFSHDVDAVVWFVTLYDLARDAPSPYRPDVHLILRVNSEDLPILQRAYGIDTWEMRLLARQRRWYDPFLFVSGERYRDYALLLSRSLLDALVPGDPSDSTLPSKPWVGSLALPAEPLFLERGANDPPMPNARWRVLFAGQDLARRRGVRLLVVNDPIFVSQAPGSEREYNAFYERKIYDRYRSTLEEFCRRQGIAYLDLWDAVPSPEFGNTPQHYLPAGNQRVARRVTERLEELLP
jgi:hypothetical protein